MVRIHSPWHAIKWLTSYLLAGGTVTGSSASLIRITSSPKGTQDERMGEDAALASRIMRAIVRADSGGYATAEKIADILEAALTEELYRLLWNQWQAHRQGKAYTMQPVEEQVRQYARMAKGSYEPYFLRAAQSAVETLQNQRDKQGRPKTLSSSEFRRTNRQAAECKRILKGLLRENKVLEE
jgi:hypothetical protein